MTDVKKSKFLSLVLRHKPEQIGITLDANGWADVASLLIGLGWQFDELAETVVNDSKKRFEFSADGTRIRASQGHSVEVDLAYEEKQPPRFLYHGTHKGAAESIRASGILRMDRHSDVGRWIVRRGTFGGIYGEAAGAVELGCSRTSARSVMSVLGYRCAGDFTFWDLRLGKEGECGMSWISEKDKVKLSGLAYMNSRFRGGVDIISLMELVGIVEREQPTDNEILDLAVPDGGTPLEISLTG